MVTINIITMYTIELLSCNSLACFSYIYLKDGELFRLEHQVQRLETENLRKDVKILQLEKQLQQFQASLFSRAQV